MPEDYEFIIKRISYGFTLKELGLIMGKNAEAARQREAKILAKLRHPKYFQKIKEFVDD